MTYKSQSPPFELIESSEFTAWLGALRDDRARVRIEARLARLAIGNAGDTKRVGWGISEMRIHYGPGYRVYFQSRGRRILLLLCGGDKRTQSADIAQAMKIAQGWSS